MSTPPPEPDSGRPNTVARRALLRFTAVSLLVLVLVIVATFFVSRGVSRDVALRHARTRGVTFAQVVGGPLVDRGVRTGDPTSLKAFSRVMKNRLRDHSMVHIKVWNRRGQVLWSDEPALRGKVFHLEAPVQRLFATGGSVANMSDLRKEENEGDGDHAQLLEVYAATHSVEGSPIIVESYWSTDSINNDARAVMLRIAPLPIGALLLFSLVILPLAWSLARRVDRAQDESRRSLQHALSASDLERRRIARDLHDGVMQDVSGAGYALSAASSALPSEAEASRRLIDEVSGLVRHVGESLRALLADIYPANLARDGLAVAVEELARRAAVEELEVDVQIDQEALSAVPVEVSQLCYRVIREGLRNVLRHAHASQAQVHATAQNGEVFIAVADNGCGFQQRESTEGHLGLRLLEDTLVDLGGSLAVDSGADGGTILSAAFPMEVALR
ncbi:MAG: two-component system, NarL family, sensor kinase [Nocardioidaceae bacterium]|nr:two-component system, NarL family, sensor kinase [Nocardioidaceae bacterium]